MRRREVPERMDDPAAPPAAVAAALRTLARLNLVAGPHRTIARLGLPGRLLDVATGDGDVPARLLRRGLATVAVGLDRGATVISAARGPARGVTLVRGDALALPFADCSFDTAVSNHFLHHLDPAGAARHLAELARVARRVVVIDLRRSRAVLALVWAVTRLSPNPLIRFDGPASVRRAFTPDEALALAAPTGRPARLRRLAFGRYALVLGEAPTEDRAAMRDGPPAGPTGGLRPGDPVSSNGTGKPPRPTKAVRNGASPKLGGQ